MSLSHATRSRTRQETSHTPDNAATNLTHPTPAQHAHNSPRNIPVMQSENQTQRENERDTRNRNLAAVNGVVIPSKVPLGQLPDQGRGVQVSNHSPYSCSICGRKFVNKNNVKVHMVPCVNRNGNPNGARWDDDWNGRVNPTGSSSQDLHGPNPARPSTSNLHQTSPASSPMNSAPSGLPQQSHQPAIPTLSQTTPQVGSPPSRPYDPTLRMDVLTNGALLAMVQAWQDTAPHVGEETIMDHPHFQRVMQELFERGIVDEDSRWMVDTETVDLLARRVVG